MNHLLLQIYFIWKLFLILVLEHFACLIQNYHRVNAVPLVWWLSELWNSSTNLQFNQLLHQQHLVNLLLLPIKWDQDLYKQCLPLVQDQHQGRSRQFCVKTQNKIHLLVKIFLPHFRIFQFHWDLLLVLKLHLQFVPTKVYSPNWRCRISLFSECNLSISCDRRKL